MYCFWVVLELPRALEKCCRRKRCSKVAVVALHAKSLGGPQGPPARLLQPSSVHGIPGPGLGIPGCVGLESCRRLPGRFTRGGYQVVSLEAATRSFHSRINSRIPGPFFRKNYNFLFVKIIFTIFWSGDPRGPQGKPKKSKKIIYFFSVKIFWSWGDGQNFLVTFIRSNR